MHRSIPLILCASVTVACNGYDDPRAQAAADLAELESGDESGDDLPAFETDAETVQTGTGTGDGPDGDDDDGEADDPQLSNTVDPQAAANTDPMLEWVLYSQPGVARLVRVNPTTGVATTAATHSFATHWVPVGVAGNKLLWQRSDTGEVSLWTIDANGNYVTHVVYTSTPGWKVRGISFDQDGQCPVPPAAQTSYTILWEGPPPTGFFAQWPKPRLWHVGDDGLVDSTESLGVAYPNTELRDFRLTAEGYGALIYQSNFSIGGDGTALDWYGRDDDGDLLRLRTDRYSAADGYIGCTARAPGVLCYSDYVDEAPGAGHKLTSMLTTRTAGGSQLPAAYLLWTKTDGTAKSYRLGSYSGKQLGPAAPVVTSHAGSSAVSFAGDSPGFCPVIQPPQDPPALPGAPVLDPPGCPWC